MQVNEVVEALTSGRMDDVRNGFSGSFKKQLSAKDLATVWSKAVEQFGPFVAAEEAAVLYDIPLHFERGRGHLQVAYRNGEIAGMVLRPGPPTSKFGEWVCSRTTNTLSARRRHQSTPRRSRSLRPESARRTEAAATAREWRWALGPADAVWHRCLSGLAGGRQSRSSLGRPRPGSRICQPSDPGTLWISLALRRRVRELCHGDQRPSAEP